MQNLEFYFMCCSIMQDAVSMALVAATLANGGVCVTELAECVFSVGGVDSALSEAGLSQAGEGGGGCVRAVV